ncbi:MAG: hypothetical protein GF375_01920 [Candidatus Omnitrophica bacterium]|nr:hypothetical protein [Candidatus Omnitrophota bacterium]MBD3268883.1 hypothetical protein [Candidatus Omnitrophota bacterium]
MIKNKVIFAGKQSQSYLTYALLMAVAAVAIAMMAGYIARRTQGSYKQAADTYGLEEQYDSGS